MSEPTSEFICPGCGRPLAITLRSDMCFAEAQIYCDDCERDYQQRRGKWDDLFTPVATDRTSTSSASIEDEQSTRESPSR
ncbi:MAG: hypothetical protein U0232_05310 [Thermomicrobiales bacterium]